MSESDVYRRQILTTKFDPRAVRVESNMQWICETDIEYGLVLQIKSNFPAFEAVDRGNETQLQMTETLNLFEPEFTIVISIHYKPRIAVAILDL